jgi:hypothetical protein
VPTGLRELSARAVAWSVVGGTLALGAALFFWQRSRSAERAPASPLEFIPPGPVFLASLDFGALAHAPLGTELVRRMNEASGPGERCAAPLLAEVEKLALAVPSGDREPALSTTSEFGIVAVGPLAARPFVDCAERLMRAHGGEPVVTHIGSFVSVRDRRHASGELAVRDGGPAILGGGSYFRDLLDAADGLSGPQKSNARDALHAELRRELDSQAPLVLSFALREGWLRGLLDDDRAEASPLAALRGVAVSVELASRARLDMLLGCSDARGCRRVGALLGELGRLVDPELPENALAVTEQGDHLRARLELDSRRSRALVDAALGVLSGGLGSGLRPALAGVRAIASSSQPRGAASDRATERAAKDSGAP